ncbi:hypothetical protein TNCT_633301 [Trichonephila clavata]|uniref:Uncharacterized protein n=1 Tax=Trichonephila clavata TaxID=2740835 RepID=A0A8X6F908_TRICU|nr:hypothetical protein TNCT_633301 [Trichonephila clavata]
MTPHDFLCDFSRWMVLPLLWVQTDASSTYQRQSPSTLDSLSSLSRLPSKLYSMQQAKKFVLIPEDRLKKKYSESTASDSLITKCLRS